MQVNGQHYQTLWVNEDKQSIGIIDQTKLPFEFITYELNQLDQVCVAIKTMQVRGAPLIGITAAFGLYFALMVQADDEHLIQSYQTLLATRPTAVNLKWALDTMLSVLKPATPNERVDVAYSQANKILQEEVARCQAIGEQGLPLIERAAKHHQGCVNILTHCNAGWLATIDWGTALAPIYMAYDKGIDVHVWVDETRPRNQGASLTAWELGKHGVAHTVIADNTGGHLMQHGQVDLCIVGTDRTTASGDVANKIGTYLKALAAYDNDVPFYVAAPASSIDWDLNDGVKEIAIEERASEEVSYITGLNDEGEVQRVRILPSQSAALNYAFDVTPARYVTGLITERGICAASREGLQTLFPEQF